MALTIRNLRDVNRVLRTIEQTLDELQSNLRVVQVSVREIIGDDREPVRLASPEVPAGPES